MKHTFLMMTILLCGCKPPASNDLKWGKPKSQHSSHTLVAGIQKNGVAYRFVDNNGKTPFVVVLNQTEQARTFADRIKKLKGQSPRDGGGLDINFEGIAFFKHESKPDVIQAVFLGKTIAYYSDDEISLQDLREGKPIKLSFTKNADYLIASASAKSSISFRYIKRNDSIYMDLGESHFTVRFGFYSESDTAKIKNVRSRRDDTLLASMKQKEAHR